MTQQTQSQQPEWPKRRSITIPLHVGFGTGKQRACVGELEIGFTKDTPISAWEVDPDTLDGSWLHLKMSWAAGHIADLLNSTDL